MSESILFSLTWVRHQKVVFTWAWPFVSESFPVSQPKHDFLVRRSAQPPESILGHHKLSLWSSWSVKAGGIVKTKTADIWVSVVPVFPGEWRLCQFCSCDVHFTKWDEDQNGIFKP